MSVPSVLFFLCLNDRGGAEQSMLALAKAMAVRGCAVTLAVYGAQPWLARDYGFAGEVIDLRVSRTVSALMPLARLVRARCFSHVLSALPHTNLVAALATLGLPAKLMVTEHGGEGLAAAQRSRLFAIMLRFFYARAFAVVAVSQMLAAQWQEFLRGGGVVQAIYNPVVPDAAMSVLPPAHAWLVDADVPVVMGIGRLVAIKNFDLLLHAFARVAASRPVRLILLGEGVERPVLQQTAQELGIEDRVLWAGYVDNVAAWLPYARVFVSASNREGLGNALIEALAAGVPVVATNCPYGPAEILADGVYGSLVPVGEVEALAQAMVKILDAAPDAGREARQQRAKAFSQSVCVDAYLALAGLNFSQ